MSSSNNWLDKVKSQLNEAVSTILRALKGLFKGAREFGEALAKIFALKKGQPESLPTLSGAQGQSLENLDLRNTKLGGQQYISKASKSKAQELLPVEDNGLKGIYNQIAQPGLARGNEKKGPSLGRP